MRVDSLVALRDDHRGVDIAVSALGKGYLFDDLIHQGVNLRIFRHGIDRGTGLQPFVEVAVVEGRAVVLTLDSACSHLEVAEAMTAVLAVLVDSLPGGVPGVPHIPDARSGEHLETVAPETTRPFGGSQGHVLHLGLFAMAHVSKTLSSCRVESTTTNETYNEESFHNYLILYTKKTYNDWFCHLFFVSLQP